MTNEELPFDMTPIEKRPKPHYSEINNPQFLKSYVTPFRIQTSVSNCMLCSMNEYTKPLDLSGGDIFKPLMIIGQDPSDVLQQYEAGSLLHSYLAQYNFNKEYIHFTSLVKCLGSSGFRECHHHLIDEILSREPLLIIALGSNVATPFMAHIAQQNNQQLSPGMGFTLENGSDMMVLNHPKEISSNSQALELFGKHLEYAFGHLNNKLGSR